MDQAAAIMKDERGVKAKFKVGGYLCDLLARPSGFDGTEFQTEVFHTFSLALPIPKNAYPSPCICVDISTIYGIPTVY